MPEEGLTKVSALAKNIFGIITLVVFLVSLGVTWGVFTSKVTALEANFKEFKGVTKERADRLEGKVFQLELHKASNDVIIKHIDKSLVDIKKSIDELKDTN